MISVGLETSDLQRRPDDLDWAECDVCATSVDDTSVADIKVSTYCS